GGPLGHAGIGPGAGRIFNSDDLPGQELKCEHVGSTIDPEICSQ
ncbi:hypothetical protein chiPu_0029075, partial [Chiloscyllium punctatum]|nr:hypothetical protein [Chiloscyllium punctatum]